jgi:DNA-binding MarR family transcriptional regulator
MARSATTEVSHAGGLGVLTEAFFSLLYIQGQIVKPIDEALDRAHGTTVTGFEVLARLARLHPEGASIRYLADQVVVSPSRVSRLTEEFVGRGLLERAASPYDGRLSLLRLTAQGRAELSRMAETFDQALRIHFLDRLTSEQVQALVDIGRALGAPHCQSE